MWTALYVHLQRNMLTLPNRNNYVVLLTWVFTRRMCTQKEKLSPGWILTQYLLLLMLEPYLVSYSEMLIGLPILVRLLFSKAKIGRNLFKSHINTTCACARE